MYISTIGQFQETLWTWKIWLWNLRKAEWTWCKKHIQDKIFQSEWYNYIRGTGCPIVFTLFYYFFLEFWSTSEHFWTAQEEKFIWQIVLLFKGGSKFRFNYFSHFCINFKNCVSILYFKDLALILLSSDLALLLYGFALSLCCWTISFYFFRDHSSITSSRGATH